MLAFLRGETPAWQLPLAKKRLHSLDNTVGVDQVSSIAEHNADTAIAGLGQFNRALHRLWTNMVTGDEMLDGYLHKYQGVSFSAYSLDLYLIPGHKLLLLVENGDDAHP